MKFKLIRFDELMRELQVNETLEESLSKIVRDIETEFEFQSMGIFVKNPQTGKYRLKIGRNISHAYMKSIFFTNEDELICKLYAKEMLEISHPQEFKFEKDFSQLLIQPVFYRNKLLAFIFIDREEDAFTQDDKIKIDIFGSITSLVLKIFEQEKLIEDMQIFDPITQLYSAKAFLHRGQELLDHMKRYNRNLSIALMKVDKFNDLVTLVGKQKAEQILKEITKIIRDNVRSTEILGILTDSSIISVFPETSSDNVYKVVNRLHTLISEIPELKEWKTFWGISELNGKIKSIEEMLKQTEEAVYDASSKGNSVAVFVE